MNLVALQGNYGWLELVQGVISNEKLSEEKQIGIGFPLATTRVKY